MSQSLLTFRLRGANIPVRIYHGHLPHIQPDGAVMFVTFRVKGSLPTEVSRRLLELRHALLMNQKTDLAIADSTATAYKKLFAAYDAELSRQCTDLRDPACILHKSHIAPVLTDVIKTGVTLKRFLLHRYCIMPNHVHLLIEPLPYNIPDRVELRVQWPPVSASLISSDPPLDAAPECWGLDEIMKSMKSKGAREINRALGRSGSLFQRENFDHWIRDGEEYQRVITYIDNNPVAAGLCSKAIDWKWGSVADVLGNDVPVAKVVDGTSTLR